MDETTKDMIAGVAYHWYSGDHFETLSMVREDYGTIIGGLIIGVLNNGLNLLNVNSFWQYVVKGTVILLAVFCGLPEKQKGGIESGLRQKRFTAVGRFLSKPKFYKKFL